MDARAGVAIGALAVAVVVAAGGCRATLGPAERGSGTSASEERTVEPFTALRVGTAVAADVSIGGPVRVRVTADDNLLDNLRTDVAGAELDVQLVNASTRTPVHVSITVPSLDRVRVDSAGRVVIDGLDAASFAIRAESGGQVEASGRVGTLTAEGASAGRLLLDGLGVGRATVRLDSAAVASLRVDERINGTVSAAAILTLSGDPSIGVATDSGGVVVRQ